MEVLKVLVKTDAGDEERTIKAYIVGNLAVHYAMRDGGQDDVDWVISSIKHGTKMPGSTIGLNAALACAAELDKVCDWSQYDREKHGSKREVVEEIMHSWGIW